MSRSRFENQLVAAVCLLAGALAAPAWALHPLRTRTELCTSADTVVIAEVTTIETSWNAEGEIERHAFAAVSRVIRGSRVDTVDILLPGGRIGDLTLTVEDVPELALDTRYLFFLSAGPQGGLGVYGGEAGAVQIQEYRGGPGEAYIHALASVADCHAQ